MREGLKGFILSNMRMTRSNMLIAGLLCMSLPSCVPISRAVKSDISKLKSKLGKPGELKANQHALDDNKPQRGLSSLSQGNVVTKVGQLTTREEEIIWAPEDPDAPIVELEGIEFNDDKPIDSWYEDYDKAIRQARVSGKPVMIWFTRSRNSPLCEVLSRELFSTREFDDWANENVVRLRVDSNIKSSNTGERRDRERQIADLKKRYSAMGQPVVVMISPRGTEFGKYRGYNSGSAEFYFGRLKNSQRTALKDHASWKSDLESRGYRVWHDARGRTVFAKVARYRDGLIWLVEPDGKKSKTKVSKLSTEDRQYVQRRIEASRDKKKGST